MKKGLRSGEIFLPEIYVASGNQIVLEPSIPLNWYNESNEPHIKAWYAGMDEFYNTVSTSTIRGPYPRKPGVYLVAFTYTGDERYKPTEYQCYVILSEFDIKD